MLVLCSFCRSLHMLFSKTNRRTPPEIVEACAVVSARLSIRTPKLQTPASLACEGVACPACLDGYLNLAAWSKIPDCLTVSWIVGTLYGRAKNTHVRTPLSAARETLCPAYRVGLSDVVGIESRGRATWISPESPARCHRSSPGPLPNYVSPS